MRALALLLLAGACSARTFDDAVPVVRVDTVLVVDARGMRCCCPCDFWLIRVLTAGNALTHISTSLDTIQHFTGDDDARYAAMLKTRTVSSQIFAPREEFFRTVWGWWLAQRGKP